LRATLKKLGKCLEESELAQLNELIGNRIWFMRSSFLSANLNDKTHTASFFQMPFFWKDEYGNDQSKNFEFRAEWNEDGETLLDYYTLKTKIAEREKLTGDFESIFEQSLQKGLNSSISFNEFIISQIQILSRDEIIDNEAELNYDEAILLIDQNKNKILLSAELKCTDQVEFICDLKTIEKRITELKIRKTLGNNV